MGTAVSDGKSDRGATRAWVASMPIRGSDGFGARRFSGRQVEPFTQPARLCNHRGMKQLHRRDLWCWSVFDDARNIDFHGYLWVRDGGNVLIDPLPLSDHDRARLNQLGGAATVVVTNSDHLRGANAIASEFGASIAGPNAERDQLGNSVTRWLGEGDEVVPGLVVLELQGSKTPGELALLLDDTTLFTGDLVRSHAGGRLDLLPDAKLSDRNAAVASVRRLVVDYPLVQSVLVGDGWPVFRDGHARLAELAAELVE